MSSIHIKYFLSFFLLMGILTCQDSTEPKEDSKETTTNNASKTNVAEAKKKEKRKRILFFGDSLTAAHGIDPKDGYTSLLEQRVDSLGLPYQLINAGSSGETTKGGLERIDWVLSQNNIDIFLLELGGNDALRGLDLDDSKKNLEGIIQKVKAKFPDVKIVLAGMEAPPNMGEAYTSKFRNIYKELSQKYHTALIPFLLKDVGGEASLNLPDGIHPNKEGQKIVAQNVWEVLKTLL